MPLYYEDVVNKILLHRLLLFSPLCFSAANFTDTVEMHLIVSHSLSVSTALSHACTQRRGGLAQAGGTLSVIRTTNGQIPHKRSLEVTPPLAPNRLLAVRHFRECCPVLATFTKCYSFSVRFTLSITLSDCTFYSG